VDLATGYLKFSYIDNPAIKHQHVMSNYVSKENKSANSQNSHNRVLKLK